MAVILTQVCIFSFESMLQLLTPFMKYLLLHPSPSSVHIVSLASHLHTSLLLLVEHLYDEQCMESSTLLLRVLTSLLPLKPTTNSQFILILANQIEVTLFCVLLLKFLNLSCLEIGILVVQDRCHRDDD